MPSGPRRSTRTFFAGLRIFGTERRERGGTRRAAALFRAAAAATAASARNGTAEPEEKIHSSQGKNQYDYGGLHEYSPLKEAGIGIRAPLGLSPCLGKKRRLLKKPEPARENRGSACPSIFRKKPRAPQGTGRRHPRKPADSGRTELPFRSLFRPALFLRRTQGRNRAFGP